MSGFQVDFGETVPGVGGLDATGSSISQPILLVRKVSVFTTVPAGAAVELPSSYAAGTELRVLNRGANVLLVTPGSGQVENYGTSLPVSVAPGGNANFCSFDPPATPTRSRTWWLTVVAFLLMWCTTASAQAPIVGPLQAQNKLSEIAAQGSSAQATARTNLGITGGGGGSPGGLTGQVQYNNSGAFGGLTNAALTALINAFTSSLSGAVPSSGGGTTNFLRADGTWAAPAGGGNVTGPSSSGNGNAAIYNGTSGTVIANGPPIGTTGNSTIVETSSGGLIAASILPTPTASTLGGVESYVAVSHQWINTISTAGVPSSTQPAFADVSGQLTLAQFPTLTANTVLGNGTGSAAVPTALGVPSCSGTTSALQWTSGTGFGCASIAGGGGGTAVVQDFVGGVDYTAGSTTTLTLSSTPLSTAAVRVYFDGVEQAANTWSLSTATITFNAAIPLHTAIVEVGWVIVAGSTVPGGSTSDIQYNSSSSFAGNGGLTYDGTSVVSLGVAGTSVGGLKFNNGTSGFIELQPTTGALGSAVLTLPDATDTIAAIAAAQTLTNKTISGASNTLSAIALASLATETANTVIGNGTGSTASPTALAVPSCSTASSALTWTSGFGFGCNSISGSGTPGGATSNVQFNSSGSFGGNGGFVYDGTSKISLGVTAASVGQIGFNNATSGQIILQPTTGALGVVTLSLPATTGNVLCDVCVQTVTGKSISGSEINSGLVVGQFGGTGVANTGKTITLGGNLTTSGAFASTFTMTAATNVTFPTAGTLLTTTGNGSSLTGLTYSQLPALGANQVLGALTATTPSGLSIPSCSTSTSALTWTTGTGFGCNAASLATITIGSTPIGGSPTSGYLLSVNGSTLANVSPIGVAGVIDAQSAYGVKCDGTTDDTTAINNALAAAGSGPSRTVVMPAGVCIVSGTLLIANNGVQFIGQGGPYGFAAAGPGTVIKTSVANGDVLSIGSTAGNVSGTLVQGFMFLSSVTRTGGDAIHRFAGTWNVMRNIYAYKMYVGYQIDGLGEPGGSGNADYDNFVYTSSFNSNLEAGIIIGAFGSTTTNGTALADFFTDVDASVNGSGSTSDHITGGIIMQNCGGCYFTNVTGIENTNGMSFVPANNEAATVFVTDMGWDSSLNAGLSFVATGTGTVGGQFAGNWYSSSGTAAGFVNTNAVGIYFGSPQSAYGETSFTGGNIYNNAANGVVEVGATQLVNFSGVNISNNSSLTSNTFDNYGMNSNTNHWNASGGYWGGANGLTNQVRYGLNMPGTGNDYITFDNIDISGTLSSGTCGFGNVILVGGISCPNYGGTHSNSAGVIGATDNHVTNAATSIASGNIPTYAAAAPEIQDSGVHISGSAVAPPDNTLSMGQSGNRWTAVWAVNGTIQTSDARLKTDVVPEPLGLDFISKLKPVEYQWTDGKSPGVHHGLIAQDVEQALDGAPFAGLVRPADDKSYYGLNYEELTAPLIRSVQQLDGRVATLWNLLIAVTIAACVMLLVLAATFLHLYKERRP